MVDEETLISLGVELAEGNEREIRGYCPVHHLVKGRGSSSPKWYMNRETGAWLCLAGDTLVITENGRVPIKKLAGTTPRLLDGNGEWVAAPVRSYGEQELRKVTLRRNGIVREVFATPDHRWYVHRQAQYPLSVVRTDDLPLGIRVPSVFVAAFEPGPVIREAVQAGFIFGDGYRERYKGVPRSTRAEFFGDKVEVADYFDGILRWTSKSSTINGKILDSSHWYIPGLPLKLKDRPSLDAGLDYLFWWLAGYFAADGSCTDKISTPTMSCASAETLEFVYDVCVLLGIRTTSVRTHMNVGIGGVIRPLSQLSFIGGLTSTFFIRGSQAAVFRGIHKKYERSGWVVVSVEETDRVEEVFCAEVSTTASFVLDGNILTGNCFSCQQRGSLQHLFELLGADEEVMEVVDVSVMRTKLSVTREERRAVKKEEPEVYISDYAFGKNPLPSVKRCDARDITPEVCEQFNVRWSNDGRCFLIPLYTTHGKLVGWQEKSVGYFCNVPNSVPKSLCLFGYQQFIGKEMIFVESPLDVLRLARHGIHGGVATMGSYVSAEQIEAGLRAAERFVLAFDDDEAGDTANEAMQALFDKEQVSYRRFRYPRRNRIGNAPAKFKDIGELPIDDVRSGLERASAFTSTKLFR